MRSLLAVAVLATPALARTVEHEQPPLEPPPAIAQHVVTLVVDAPDNDLVALAPAIDVRAVRDKAIVTLKLTMTGSADEQATHMWLSLPHDASVVGMTFDRGHEMMVAQPVAQHEARARFDHLAERPAADPALLELGRGTGDVDRYELSVFPISTDEHVTATVTITMPRFEHLIANLGGRNEELIAAASVVPTADDLALLAQPRAVLAGHSLMAEPNRPPTALGLHDAFRAARMQLRACLGDQLDATVHYTVAIDGTVTNVDIDAPAEAATCVTRVVDTFQFAAIDRPFDASEGLHYARD